MANEPGNKGSLGGLGLAVASVVGTFALAGLAAAGVLLGAYAGVYAIVGITRLIASSFESREMDDAAPSQTGNLRDFVKAYSAQVKFQENPDNNLDSILGQKNTSDSPVQSSSFQSVVKQAQALKEGGSSIDAGPKVDMAEESEPEGPRTGPGLGG